MCLTELWQLAALAMCCLVWIVNLSFDERWQLLLNLRQLIKATAPKQQAIKDARLLTREVRIIVVKGHVL